MPRLDVSITRNWPLGRGKRLIIWKTSADGSLPNRRHALTHTGRSHPGFHGTARKFMGPWHGNGHAKGRFVMFANECVARFDIGDEWATEIFFFFFFFQLSTGYILEIFIDLVISG
ncbi:hypothetical protein CEXT_611101 [Caerostris extrusa]|uniref:Uncharacterized protein n=1 Tax=Caerostris extrusa TaxID=172846 RepID=A0AAV4WFT7_CAEEX|nr:hypothetical protein CEXT_611101 [Caerostris extrusa]